MNGWFLLKVYTYIYPTFYIVEGKDLAKRLQCKFIETSAKQKLKVDDAYYAVVREIRKYEGDTGKKKKRLIKCALMYLSL